MRLQRHVSKKNSLATSCSGVEKKLREQGDQLGLSTRAGTEALYKLLQVAAECNPASLSCRLMLSVCSTMFPHRPFSRGCDRGLSLLLSFHLLASFSTIYGSESSYIWTDDAGTEHEVLQAEGGVLSDALGPRTGPTQPRQDPCLERGRGGAAQPHRAPTKPELCCRHRVGAWTLPAERQGLVVLGAPFGTEASKKAFVQRQLRDKRRRLRRLAIGGLLLLFCASARANYLLRMLPPHRTADYSSEHDHEEAPELSADALATARFPLGMGGLGQLPAPLTGPPGRMPSLRCSNVSPPTRRS